MAPKKDIRWIQKWVPKCPYDNNELRFRAQDADPEFFYSCDRCNRTWPITIQDGEIVRTGVEMKAWPIGDSCPKGFGNEAQEKARKSKQR